MSAREVALNDAERRILIAALEQFRPVSNDARYAALYRSRDKQEARELLDRIIRL